MTYFFSATEAKKSSLDLGIVNEEIYRIQQHILNKISLKEREVEISDTPMTDISGIISREYFDAWSENLSSSRQYEEINLVKNHFESLGYAVSIIQNPVTLDTFKWIIRW